MRSTRPTELPSGASATGAPTAFSQLLRQRSWERHQQAEGAEFMIALMAGRIDLAGYVAMVTAHLFVYEALETVAHTLRQDPVAARFISDRLTRLPSLRADLSHLLGDNRAAAVEPMPATRRYAERIRAMTGWPAGFVAHHYTRYLGDLSGGLAIGAVVARTYGFTPGGDGVRFYRFSEIPKPKVFKDEYRARLDTAPWGAEECERVVDEVLTAYQLNTEVFAELGRAHAPVA